MSIVDKIKEMLAKNPDMAEEAMDKAGDVFDSTTGGKYADKVDMAQEKAEEFIEGQRPLDQPPAS